MQIDSIKNVSNSFEELKNKFKKTTLLSQDHPIFMCLKRSNKKNRKIVTTSSSNHLNVFNPVFKLPTNSQLARLFLHSMYIVVIKLII